MSTSPARLRALASVFETGSFTEAARELGVSVPTVTQLIRDFERDADIRLFEKQSRQLIPTYVAKNLYPIAVKFRETEREAADVVRQFTDFERGELRVALGNASEGMMIVAGFQKTFPNVEIKVHTGNWANVLALVEDEQVDVGMLPEVPKDGRFERTLCRRQRVFAVMSQSSALSVRDQLTCADLANEPLIFRSRGSSTQRQVDRGFKAAGLSPVPRISADTRDSLLEAVYHNLGVGFVWQNATSGYRDLARIEVEEISKEVGEYTFFKKGRESRLVNAFVGLAAKGLHP